jgi:IS5 family transposase
MNQIEMISLEQLVAKNHSYRKFNEIWSFEFPKNALKKLEKDNPYKGYGLLRLFKCLLLQFMEDLSDRELERYIQENTAAKWFCNFSLSEQTPDYSVYSKIRKRIGTKLLSEIFSELKNQLRQNGLMSEVFTFVDASHLIAKADLWKERDKAIKKKYEKLNNETLPKVSVDKQARIGCKGKDKYWYGYKKHVSVDMQSGLINKIAITPANTTDGQGFKHVCPQQGSIYADKGYCGKATRKEAEINGCHLAAIKKQNMKGKNKDLDRWYSGLRSPYERVFSKSRKKTRYRGVVKNQFSAFMEAICFNLKRLTVLNMKGLCLN